MSDKTLDFAIRAFLTWLFRRRHPEVVILKIAITALATTVLSLVVGADVILKWVQLNIEVGSLDTYGKLAAGLLMVVVSICMLIAYIRFQNEQKRLNRQRTIIIEGRGLRDDLGESLSSVASQLGKGIQIPIILDLRQKVNETIVSPEATLPRIAAMREALNQHKAAHNADDLTVVYGGLAPVPLTVLSGVEVDDEGAIEVVDWDREKEAWRALDVADDGKRFSIEGMNSVKNARRVVVAVSVSYPISSADLQTTFNMPIVRLELEGGSASSHWSGEKQAALALQFLELVKALSGQGVEEIHLVLAAPNSVSFNLGRRYDRRNLPNLFVYQYERSRSIKYPWSVRIPVIGQAPEIVHTTAGSDGFAVEETP